MRLEELREEVERGTIDTVILAIADMQGRLQGKRLVARYFVEETQTWPGPASCRSEQGS